ncbi:MAG: hypothetical protein AB8H80_15550 [Planctomycetota bacterium]
MSLLRSVQERAARNGLNLFGLVRASRYDSCQPSELRSRSVQPDCGTIVVLGTGGRAFWSEFHEQQGYLPSGIDGDAADEIAAAGVQSVAERLASEGYAVRAVDARSRGLGFAQLAEDAGFGIISPVSGMLIHPKFGPWVRVRGALLLPGEPFGNIPDASIAETFKPCCTCRDRPCVTACPPMVHDEVRGADRQKCADHRVGGGCGTGCSSRMACPIGQEHADGSGPTLHAHTVGLRTLQRWFGLGWWRMVPKRLRSMRRS